MVDSGNVTLVALQNEFQETGTGRVTLELYPSNNFDSESLPEQNGTYTVEIPTRLNESDWEAQLENELEGIEQDFEVGDPNVLNLSVDPDALEVNSVGIQIEPTGSDESSEEGPKEEEPAEDLTVDDESGNLLGEGVTGGGEGGPGRFEFGIRNSGERNLDIIALGVINTTPDIFDRVERDGDNAPLTKNDTNLMDSDEVIIIDSETNQSNRSKFLEDEKLSIDGGQKREDLELFSFEPGQGGQDIESLNITVWVENEDGEESHTNLTLVDEGGGNQGGGNQGGGNQGGGNQGGGNQGGGNN